MSILPEEVHPRRWYAGAAILAALVRHLILAWSADKVRRSIDRCGARLPRLEGRRPLVQAAARLALVLEGRRARGQWCVRRRWQPRPKRRGEATAHSPHPLARPRAQAARRVPRRSRRCRT
jgi:hypothetical protein